MIGGPRLGRFRAKERSEPEMQMRSARPSDVVVMHAGRHITWHHGVPFHHDRRRGDGFQHHWRFGVGGSRDRCGTADAGVLHRRDDRFADTLLVQRDDVGDGELSIDAAILDLRQDDRIAEARAAHRGHVRQRHDALGQRLRGRDDRLLLSGDGRTLLLYGDTLFIGRVAKDSPGNRSDHAADRRAGTGFVVVITDQTSDDRASDSANGRPPLLLDAGSSVPRSVLGVGQSGEAQDQCKAKRNAKHGKIAKQGKKRRGYPVAVGIARWQGCVVGPSVTDATFPTGVSRVIVVQSSIALVTRSESA